MHLPGLPYFSPVEQAATILLILYDSHRMYSHGDHQNQMERRQEARQQSPPLTVERNRHWFALRTTYSLQPSFY